MADNEQPDPSTTAVAQVETPAPSSTPALTVESIKEALLPEIRRETKAAYDAARRAEAKAERAPDKFREQIAPLEEAIEAILTQSLNEDQRQAFIAKRDLARATRRDPDAEQAQQVAEFQTEAASVLEEEGIKADDPVLVAAYQKYLAGAKNPSQWRTALGRAIAAVHKDLAVKSESSASEREKKAREDERTKVQNERRESDGPVDRGQPASSNQKVDWANLSPEEFALKEAAYDAERKARRMRAG